MRDKTTAAQFHRSADKVRRIALGIFDDAERRAVLRFVDASEKLAAPTVRVRKPI